VSIASDQDADASDTEITGQLTGRVRARRDPRASTGRTYTLTVVCADASGHTATGTASVTVLRDRRP
jgi:hypothetical protein